MTSFLRMDSAIVCEWVILLDGELMEIELRRITLYRVSFIEYVSLKAEALKHK